MAAASTNDPSTDFPIASSGSVRFSGGRIVGFDKREIKRFGERPGALSSEVAFAADNNVSDRGIP